MGRFLRIGDVWARHVNNSYNFDPRTRLGDKCKEELAEPSKKPFLKELPFGRQKWNLGRTLAEPFWNLPWKLLAAQDGSAPHQRHHKTWNIGGTLVKPWWNLGGTFRGTCWQPKMEVPQKTGESPKAILPRNLYYG